MRNLLAKILLGVVFVLLALHLAIHNVSIRTEGSWSTPSFTLQFGKTNNTLTEESKEAVDQHEQPLAIYESAHDVPIIIGGQNHNPEATPTSAAEATTTQESESTDTNDNAISKDEQDEQEEMQCAALPGAEDVVFIIKTGATEVQEKIPVHLQTTLRCYPKSLIFSDFGEDFQGHTIHDALGHIVDHIRLDHEDFGLWRKLNERGRAALDESELSSHDQGHNLGSGGNPSNGGWRLDKFKNIPMVNYTINKFPDTKWFIFTDADTYIVWSNLLKWVDQMDSTRLTYLGSAAVIGTQVFAHGGSGYIISNALMHTAAEAYNADQEEWDSYAEAHWAGDCVLATLLERLGAPLDWAFPHLQGGDNNVMNFWETGYNRRIWCYPAVSYHHIPTQTIASLWHFEQEWIAKSSARINHGDVYKHWYMPQLSEERHDWDNLSEQNETAIDASNSWQCRDACNDNNACMQWSFDGDRCKLHAWTRLGHASEHVTSGWMLDRISAKVRQIDRCNEGDWILPEPRVMLEKNDRMLRH